VIDPDHVAVAAFAPTPGDEAQRASWAAEPFAAAPAGLPRAFDVVVAAFVLVVLSPFLLAAMVAVRLDSRGPALYRARRVGRHEREFVML
jgi:lipopolysaccharide/colanic/teichoic acid biosynthesis glycosyltransferase